MNHFDIIIVGGGIGGASLGSEVAGKRRTLIIEAEDVCGYHSTGRSAAFWLESYGGPHVALLSGASRAFLDSPPEDFSECGFLYARGAIHVSDSELPELPPTVTVREVSRAELERVVPGIHPRWHKALLEPGCADIDVAGLHAAYLKRFRRNGGDVATRSRLLSAKRKGENWIVTLEDGTELSACVLVDSAGAWVDSVAEACGVRRIGFEPKRRTMVQLKVGRTGLKDMPLIDDAAGSFYFKGETDSSIWLSPHDEIESEPCDAAPEEIDIATAIDRFEGVVDWPIQRIERSWAGLRTFAPDRLPVYGFEPSAPGFFWCAGQGGFGIQTAPAAAKMAAALLLGEDPGVMVAHIEPATFSPARFG